MCIWGRSSVWLERLPVTQKVTGSSPAVPAKSKKKVYLFLNIQCVIITKSHSSSSLDLEESLDLFFINSREAPRSTIPVRPA